MSAQQDGGPAFPNPSVWRPDDTGEPFQWGADGMSLRDWFAGQALAGFMQANGWVGYFKSPKHRQFLLDTFARDSYAIADAMLTQRTREASDATD